MLRYVDATHGCLLAAGFGHAAADHARHALDSHIHGFTLQALHFPAGPGRLCRRCGRLPAAAAGRAPSAPACTGGGSDRRPLQRRQPCRLRLAAVARRAGAAAAAWSLRQRRRPRQPRASNARIARATWPIGITTSTAPSAMASLGMPKTTQVASSWAMVRAPGRAARSSPRAPSSPMPVSMIASASRPGAVGGAAEQHVHRGLWRFTGGPSTTTA